MSGQSEERHAGSQFSFILGYLRFGNGTDKIGSLGSIFAKGLIEARIFRPFQRGDLDGFPRPGRIAARIHQPGLFQSSFGRSNFFKRFLKAVFAGFIGLNERQILNLLFCDGSIVFGGIFPVKFRCALGGASINPQQPINAGLHDSSAGPAIRFEPNAKPVELPAKGD